MRERKEPSIAVTIVGSALSMLVIGGVDYATGIDLRVFPLYFVPVLAVSLRLGQGPGLAAAGASALTWLVSNHLAGLSAHGAAMNSVNALVMGVAFAAVALLGAAQRRGLERERATSRTDGLTGLLNGRGFQEAATAELVRARRYRHPVTLAYFDLDGFKAINDRFGHLHGDSVLVRVADVIRAVTRRSDIVARLGGDEFAVLLAETDHAAAEPTLRKVLARLGRIEVEDGTHVTASIGSVSFSEPPAEIAVLLHEADAVMYTAKAAGKNTLRCEIAGARG